MLRSKRLLRRMPNTRESIPWQQGTSPQQQEIGLTNATLGLLLVKVVK